ncbi:MAG: 30S ribosome-binding factor RbfA [Mariprofundaceae bacterium]|nr:30S ribosome-binding factor RbfA [Mariprofundaceae bacterium]
MAKSVNQRLQRDVLRLLTELLRRDVDDPQLSMLTLTEVEISHGSYDATVRVCGFDVQAEAAKSMVGRLNRMAPHFGHSLRRALKKKTIPKLHFVWDESMDKTADMMALLRDIRHD